MLFIAKFNTLLKYYYLIEYILYGLTGQFLISMPSQNMLDLKTVIYLCSLKRWSYGNYN